MSGKLSYAVATLLIAWTADAATVAAHAPRPSADAQARISLNVRSGPGTGYRVLDVLRPGEPVRIVRRSGGWCLVVHDGPRGWASCRFLSPLRTVGPPPSWQPPPWQPPPPAFPPPPGPPPGYPSHPPGGIGITGTLTGEGVECPALRGDDGRLYTLTGSLGPFRTGDRVRVIGRPAQVSTCMQGTTIAVQAISPAF